MRSLLSLLRLLVTWDRVRTSFWFLPSVLVAAAFALSLAMTRLDAALDRATYHRLDLLYLFGPEGARSILSAIASSMITVAGLTFSITMLTLQAATSQFGPRLLRNFMRDRGNQLVLGTFISTFLYCLLVLRTVKGTEDVSFVPHLAVAMGVVLAVASLAVLIYFIHHTAHSLRIETILASLAAETEAAIDLLYPDPIGREPTCDAGRDAVDFSGGHEIAAKGSGYVQALDGERAMALACQNDLVIRLLVRPGAFVTVGEGLMLVLPKGAMTEDLASDLRATVFLGDERTPDQDLDFSIRRIVEIAQRSLSPGINDPTTALYCIDRLRQAFVRLAGRRSPSKWRVDDQGFRRVLADPSTFETLACRSFSAVLRHAGADADVLEALAFALDRVLEAAGNEPMPRLDALWRAVQQRMPQWPWKLS